MFDVRGQDNAKIISNLSSLRVVVELRQFPVVLKFFSHIEIRLQKWKNIFYRISQQFGEYKNLGFTLDLFFYFPSFFLC